MGNKQSLQFNNGELQVALKTIQSLPSAQKWQGGTIVPGKVDIMIPAYTDQVLTVQGEANLKSENIKRGVSIYGIMGNAPEYKITFGEVYFPGTYSEETYEIAHGLTSTPTHYGINGKIVGIVETTGNPRPSIYISVDSVSMKVTVPRLSGGCEINWVAISKL